MEYDSKKLLIIVVLLLIWNYTTSKTTEKSIFTTIKVEEVKIDQKQVELLARLIYSEANGEPYKGKLAVGNVVLNRMERKNITLEKVIFQKGQFDGIRTSRFKYKYKDDESYQICLKAATELLNGHRILPSTVEFFHNPETSTDTGWTRYLEKTARKNPPIDIGNHRFFHNPNLV